MKPLRNALATLLLAALPVAAQDADPPVPVAAETAAEPAVHPVPPVRLTNIVVQTIGEERHNEELRPGLLFIDESSGKLMVSDESNPHGRFVCACKDFPDYHNFTNTIRVNGHKIELNQAFSLQAENDILSFRFGTNSVLQILPVDVGEYARVTASYEDETHLLVSANAPADAVLQVTTNLLSPTPWTTATNAVVVESDDASTTWRVTLDDASTGVEIYRVLGSVARPAGAYAYKPLHAEQGVVIPEGQSLAMGHDTWTNLPDMSDYATAASLADAVEPLATTQSVASLEGRVKRLEMPETCVLWWTTNLTSSADRPLIPTNFPTRKLEVRIDRGNCNGAVALFDCNWNPGREVEVRLVTWTATNSALAFRLLYGTNIVNVTTITATNTRELLINFDPVSKAWRTSLNALSSAADTMSIALTSDGQRLTPTGPVTVEEWLALREDE